LTTTHKLAHRLSSKYTSPSDSHPAQVPTFVRVLFTNGTYHDTATAEEMEEYIQELQWSFYWSRKLFREDMAERAWRVTEVELDTDGSSLDFLRELERAGFYNFGLHYDHADGQESPNGRS
jgi:hypothetical protein